MYYKRVAVIFGPVVIFLMLLIGVYKLGQKSQSKVTWFADLAEKTRGQRVYLIDINVICSNGKDLGKLQVDLNLTNGRLRVIRNDPGLEPNCSK